MTNNGGTKNYILGGKGRRIVSVISFSDKRRNLKKRDLGRGWREGEKLKRKVRLRAKNSISGATEERRNQRLTESA